MFWAEPAVGSGQYIHHLVSTLAHQETNHRFVLVIPRSAGIDKPQVPGVQVVMMPTPFDRHSRNLAKLWFEQIAIQQACRRLRVDLLHVPYFAAPLRSTLSVVVTIHDLIPLLLPAYRGSRQVQLYMRLAAAGARRARAVIADSRHSRQDIIEHLGIPPERVTVTYLAASPHFGPRNAEVIAEVRGRFRLQRPYIFYIGGFDARKNVEMVVRAFAAATQGWEDPPQLAIGGRLPDGRNPLFSDVNQLIVDAGVAGDVALLGAVSDDDKAALMAGSAAFVYPSRYEGFGLPPLEAMQCGAPVIASRATCIPEVVGDAGLLVDPDDLPGWVGALRSVLTDAGLAESLRRRGVERARRFTWEQTVAATLPVYEAAMRR
jgi:glycosyltransferase involved in cell wall biosynthesis